MFDGEGKKFKLITKKSLASACRKFISRYLVSTRNDTDYSEKADLAVNLTRYEFWPAEYFINEDIFNKEIDFLKKEKLTIGQCYELYNLMGGDEKEEMKGIKVKKFEEKEDDDIEEEEDDDRFVRHRKDNKKPKQKKQRKNYT